MVSMTRNITESFLWWEAELYNLLTGGTDIFVCWKRCACVELE